MRVTRRSGSGLAALAAVLAVAAPEAVAGELTFRTVAVTGLRGEPGTGQVATYVAGPGERNAVDVRFGRRTLRLRDAAGIRAAPRCLTEVDGTVACRVAQFLELEARLADGDDELSAPHGVALTVDGGDGDDRLAGGGWLAGGPGRDELHSRRGASFLSGGPGADLLDPAGGGILDYSERTAGVTVDMRGDAAAGEHGEGDRVLPGATAFRGGMGADLVVAPEGGAVLEGGAGDDRLVGGALGGNSADGDAGDDWIVGGARYDRLEGGLGSDVLSGQAGDDELFADGDFSPASRGDHDRLQGDDGDDYLLGADGVDMLDGGEGRDMLIGRAGVDRLLARDRSADHVLCADTFDAVPVPGHDLAVLDRRDHQLSCGFVERTGPAAAELLGAEDVRAERRRHGGVLRVYVGCPAGAPGRECEATIRVVVHRGRPLRCALRLPAGARRKVRIAFDAPFGDAGMDVRLASPAPSGRVRRRHANVDSGWPRPFVRQAPPDGGAVPARTARCRR